MDELKTIEDWLESSNVQPKRQSQRRRPDQSQITQHCEPAPSVFEELAHPSLSEAYMRSTRSIRETHTPYEYVRRQCKGKFPWGPCF